MIRVIACELTITAASLQGVSREESSGFLFSPLSAQ